MEFDFFAQVQGEMRASDEGNSAAEAEQHSHNIDFDWVAGVIFFYLPTAISLALHSHQQQTPAPAPAPAPSSRDPHELYVLCISITLSLPFLYLAKFIHSKFPVLAMAFQRIGVFFVVTTIFVGISSPLPSALKYLIGAIYAIFMVSVVLFHIAIR